MKRGVIVVLIAILVCADSVGQPTRRPPYSAISEEILSTTSAAFLKEQVGLDAASVGNRIEVKAVLADSPAARAGVKPGDLVVAMLVGVAKTRYEVEGSSIRLAGMIEEDAFRGIAECPLIVKRAGVEIILNLQTKGLRGRELWPGRTNPIQKAANEDQLIEFVCAVRVGQAVLGVGSDDSPQNNQFPRGPIVIKNIVAGDFADKAGLKAGDEIVRIKQIFLGDTDRTYISTPPFLREGFVGMGREFLRPFELAVTQPMVDRFADRCRFVLEGRRDTGSFDFVIDLLPKIAIRTSLQAKLRELPGELSDEEVVPDMNVDDAPSLRLALLVDSYKKLTSESHGAIRWAPWLHDEGRSAAGLKLLTELEQFIGANGQKMTSRQNAMGLRIAALVAARTEQDCKPRISKWLRAEFLARAGEKPVFIQQVTRWIGAGAGPSALAIPTPRRDLAASKDVTSDLERITRLAEQRGHARDEIDYLVARAEFLDEADKFRARLLKLGTETEQSRKDWLTLYELWLFCSRSAAMGSQDQFISTQILPEDADVDSAPPGHVMFSELVVSAARDATGVGIREYPELDYAESCRLYADPDASWPSRSTYLHCTDALVLGNPGTALAYRATANETVFLTLCERATEDDCDRLMAGAENAQGLNGKERDAMRAIAAFAMASMAAEEEEKEPEKSLQAKNRAKRIVDSIQWPPMKRIAEYYLDL